MRFYAVADPHGFCTHLIEALTNAGYFDDDGEKKLVLCGDALDRGNEAVMMAEFLEGELDAGRLIYILGNHEELLSDCMLELVSRGTVSMHHLTNGTWNTLVQLSGMDVYDAESYPEMLVSNVRSSSYYTKVLQSCRDYYETKNYVFCHGYIPTVAEKTEKGLKYFYDPNWREAAYPQWRSARWVNGMAIACHHGVKEPGKTVVCGHWHCSYGHSCVNGKGTEYGHGAIRDPFYAEGIIGLDATTVSSNKVNCIVIEDEEL